MKITVLNACDRLIAKSRLRHNTVMHFFRRLGFSFGGRYLAFGLGCALLAGVLSLATWVVWEDHREAEVEARRTVQNLAQVLEHDIARSIQLYDMMFADVTAALQISGVRTASPEMRQAALFSHISEARYISALLVLDEHGDLIFESKNAVPRRVNFADRDYFKAFRDHADASLYFSHPHISRIDGMSNLAISRRLAHADGSFAGAVTTGIHLDHFQDLFAGLDLGLQGSVTLLRDDGILLARRPAEREQIGRDLHEAAVFQHLRDAPSGVFESTAKVDGVERVFGYRRIADTPLVIVVGLSRAEVFAPWRRKTIEVAAIMTVLVGLAILLTAGLRRELQQRLVAEAAAQQSAQDAIGAAKAANQAAQKLAETLQQLDVLFANSADALFVARRQATGDFVYEVLNPKAEALTGLPAWSILGRTPEACLAPEAARSIQKHWRQCAQERRTIRYSHTLNLTDGPRDWETLLVPVLDHAQQVCVIVGASRDVTERKRNEDTLKQLNEELAAHVDTAVAAREAALARATQGERMQALGLLAGGVAHDFNNVLQAVSGYAEIIERRGGDAATTRRLAQLTIDAAARGTSITRRLLAFSRRDALQAELIDAASMLTGLQEILGHTLDPAVAVHTKAAPGLPRLFADKQQLETVLLNLATNARDAMPDGGSLTMIAAEEAVLDGATHAAGLAPGRYVRLSVVDTGAGMSAATLARVAEPFFTTKSAGKGTGLGLSMAKGFAEQSGGRFAIESRLGFGTMVTLWMPDAASSGMDPTVAPANPTHRLLQAV